MSSPNWNASNKRIVLIILFILALLLFYRVRILIVPLSLAAILAYLIEPGVKFLSRRTPLNRTLSIVLIYLLLIALVISIPVTAVSPIIVQGSNFINNLPRWIVQLGDYFSEPIVLSEGYEIPVDQLPLDQLFLSLSANLVTIVQTLGGRTLTIFGSVATATISTVGWGILILFISFYLVKDHDRLFEEVLNMIPNAYHDDIRHLSHQISLTWNAFLRGQLVLCLVVGVIVFVMALIMGLPNARNLAIFAGLMELVPTFGPILAAIPAVLIAFFQSDASWLSAYISPFWFGLIIVGLYALIYQFENYYLVPRIIGYHLKLHPLVILLGVVGGASVAGIIGILLAAPVLASARLVLRYIYCKLTDQSPFMEEIVALERVDTAVKPKPSPTNENRTTSKSENQDTAAI
ncbi:MAG: AI-2E family transporter [Chloroflexi bacterium]|nr:AI-2E family transporter [Chloroflexota bacterium]